MCLMQYLFYLVMCVLYVDGSHFRGGIITWKPIGSDQVEISYRVAFRTTYSSDHFCNDATIKAGNLVNGEGALVCSYGGSLTEQIASPMSYLCTDFSVTEDWTAGQRIITYMLPSTNYTILRFSYGYCCWISLVEGGGGSWIMQTTADVSIRHDTGKINTSPISAMAPIVRVQQGCSVLLNIPTSDDDQDIVKCRWATKTPVDECGSVCQTLSGSILQEMPCALNYTANGSTGWYGVALQIEDFSYSMPTQRLSSVALQFLLYVFNSKESCQSKPSVNATNTTNSPTVKILLNSTFFQTIIADSGSFFTSITSINTNSPIGMTKSELHKVSAGGTEWYVNVTWTPSSTQTGSHIFCYWAINSNGQSSDQVCQTLYVAVCPTDMIANTARTSTGELPGDTVTYSCNPQYILTSGSLTRTCQSDGTWTETAPFCTIMCLDPDVVPNAVKTQTGDKPNDTASYLCNTQYELTFGDLVRTCQNNGTWSGTPPTCTIMCPEVIVNNSVWRQTGDNPRDTVTYTCNPQYERISGDLERTCQTSGNWNGTTPICTIMCPEVAIVNNAVWRQTGDNPGDTVTYACNPKYEVTSGDLVRTCQTSGNWNGTTPICTIVCQKPDDVVNATKTLYGDNPGENVTYVCNKQHEVTSGNLTRMCQTNGVWDGNVPICTIMCPEPVIVNNSLKSQTGDNPGDIVAYKCNAQYEVTSGNLVQTCQTSGNWNGTIPICTIMCQNPGDILNANKTVYGDNPGEMVTYVCNKQHEVTSGNLTRTCQTNGVWDGNIPVCTIMCPEPVDVLNASKIFYGDNPGENVTYTCDEQHEVTSGNLTRTCLHSGLWDGDVPVCIIMCQQPEDVYKANKTYTGNNPDDNVTYICEKVENHVIGFYSRTCQFNGSWSSFIPGCMCDPPPIVSNAVWERNGSTAYPKCNDGFYSKGNLQIHCSVNSSWTSLTDKCYKESSIDFIIVASVLCFGVLSSLIASAAILLKRKPKKSSQESTRDESDTEDNFNDADAENLVPQLERSVAPVSSTINSFHNTRIDPQYEHPETPTELFCTDH